MTLQTSAPEAGSGRVDTERESPWRRSWTNA